MSSSNMRIIAILAIFVSIYDLAYGTDLTRNRELFDWFVIVVNSIGLTFGLGKEDDCK